MTLKNPIPQLLESRLSGYFIAASAVVATVVPSQAAPITVLLPSPVNITSGPYFLNLDGNSTNEFFFTAFGSGFLVSAFGGQLVGNSGVGAPGIVELLSSGTSAVLAHTDPIWRAIGTAAVPSTTSPDYFLGLRFFPSSGLTGLTNMTRIGFAQLNGPLLYGWAWEEAPSITIFDLRNSASNAAPVPEPATGALTALALGAAALAARKRKQT